MRQVKSEAVPEKQSGGQEDEDDVLEVHDLCIILFLNDLIEISFILLDRC